MKSILHSPLGHLSSTWTQFTSNLSTLWYEEERKARKARITRVQVTSGVQLIASGKELGGRNRYVVDGFLNSTECNFLMQLAQVIFINLVKNLQIKMV